MLIGCYQNGFIITLLDHRRGKLHSEVLSINDAMTLWRYDVLRGNGNQEEKNNNITYLNIYIYNELDTTIRRDGLEWLVLQRLHIITRYATDDRRKPSDVPLESLNNSRHGN